MERIDNSVEPFFMIDGNEGRFQGECRVGHLFFFYATKLDKKSTYSHKQSKLANIFSPPFPSLCSSISPLPPSNPSAFVFPLLFSTLPNFFTGIFVRAS